MQRQLHLALFVVLGVWASRAAANCPGDDWWSVERETREARFVFVGTPVKEWPDRGVDGWIAGTFYRLKVEKVVTGAATSFVDLFSENSSGRFPMKMGVRYVVFASSCDGRLYAYSRGNSGTWRKSQDVFSQVIQLQSQRWPSAPLGR